MVESVSRTGRELLNRPGTAEWKGAAKIREACGQVLAFFMILVDTSQTLKVKSKSVSDMDFPDQSQCANTDIASLLDHTSYLSLFLHNRNLRPRNFTLESA